MIFAVLGSKTVKIFLIITFRCNIISIIVHILKYFAKIAIKILKPINYALLMTPSLFCLFCHGV